MSDLATATANAAVKSGKPTVEDLVLARRNEISRVLGQTMDSDEFLQNAITVLRNNPQLMRASVPSLLGALYLSAQLKLRVGGLAPQVHLTPRTVGGELVVVPIIDYRGYLHLAHNTDRFSKIEAFTVHENDDWHMAASSERGQYFDHTPAEGDRGPIVGVVGLAKLRGADDSAWVYLTTPQVQADHRPKKWESTPWKTHEAAMYRKTAIRELSKWIPNSTEMAVAAADDEAVIRKVDGVEELQVEHDVPAALDTSIRDGSEPNPDDPEWQAHVARQEQAK
jgi:recombination protein RecT